MTERWRWQAEMEIDALRTSSFNLPARARFRLYDPTGRPAGEAANQDEAELIVRAVNAFAALLAVAKAVDARVAALNPGHEWHGWQWNAMEEAMMTLNNDHPGWREWTP